MAVHRWKHKRKQRMAKKGFRMHRWMKSISRRIMNHINDNTRIEISKVYSYEQYTKLFTANKQRYEDRLLFEKSLLSGKRKEFTFGGYCFVCNKKVKFLVDYRYSYKVDDILMPNWRERLVCPSCNLNNRMRATIQILEQECEPKNDSKIYITEQATPLYNWFKKSYPHIIGSEYLGGSVSFGGINEQGIRNEDITKLSFNDQELDYILSFDVFEHISEYKKAIKECYRCLQPEGLLLLSVPFVRSSRENIVRAKVSEDGQIQHLLPTEYHGDPIRAEGCLCFYHFGWQMLDDMRSAGFENVTALLFWSRELGYLGEEQILLTAMKKNR